MIGGGRASERTLSLVRIVTTWVIGIAALLWAFSPPELITQFYTAGVGVLSSSLFVPTVAGLWWKRANLAGGVGAVVSGAGRLHGGAAGHCRHRPGAGSRRARGQRRSHDPGRALRSAGIQRDGRGGIEALHG